MAAMADDFDCEAYGPEGREVGALCFFAGELGARVCASQDECRDAMTAERRRVFRRINEMAAHGDPAAVDLAETFTYPARLLGGGPTERDCPDLRPVLDEAIGWYCPACGAEAPPDAGPPAPGKVAGDG